MNNYTQKYKFKNKLYNTQDRPLAVTYRLFHILL